MIKKKKLHCTGCTGNYRERWQKSVRGLSQPERGLTLLSFNIKRLQRKGKGAEAEPLWACVCLASPLINNCTISWPRLWIVPPFLLVTNIIFASSFTATQLSMHIITCPCLPKTLARFHPFLFCPFTHVPCHPCVYSHLLPPFFGWAPLLFLTIIFILSNVPPHQTRPRWDQ